MLNESWDLQLNVAFLADTTHQNKTSLRGSHFVFSLPNSIHRIFYCAIFLESTVSSLWFTLSESGWIHRDISLHHNYYGVIQQHQEC